MQKVNQIYLTYSNWDQDVVWIKIAVEDYVVGQLKNIIAVNKSF